MISSGVLVKPPGAAQAARGVLFQVCAELFDNPEQFSGGVIRESRTTAPNFALPSTLLGARCGKAGVMPHAKTADTYQS
jgi:hypothetical protein